ncbi:hypothetical protein HYPDE_30898 [Hyphomicrobium denitrificans 1NES1]|uniref:Uncharacterized protein n=1 Tax=Hyphomicrobium denitrificans 1NES1 TaxID=670307 RepID=N0B2U8_9HYPH|nr:hypothetical protein HYPDE_30898 [Hyphomicrobium denitrificans 1NES1]
MTSLSRWQKLTASKIENVTLAAAGRATTDESIAVMKIVSGGACSAIVDDGHHCARHSSYRSRDATAAKGALS